MMSEQEVDERIKRLAYQREEVPSGWVPVDGIGYQRGDWVREAMKLSAIWSWDFESWFIHPDRRADLEALRDLLIAAAAPGVEE
jgi:hypothetical protein